MENVIGINTHKDGFCRAPRMEMAAENSSFNNMSFGELLNQANFECNEHNNMKLVRTLAKQSSID